MTVDLVGHVVVITGAAGALGGAYARECARLGAAVMLTDLPGSRVADVAEGISRTGGIARWIEGDITDPGFSATLATECLARWGVLTGWVNNAGVQRLQGIDSTDVAAVETMVRVNVLGCIYGSAAAARVMIRQGSGVILNATSGAQHGMEQLAVYGATKGAAASLTYAMAVELAEHGIRVNAISPLANTPMSVDGDVHFSRLLGTEVQVAPSLSDPEQVAPVVGFLLSDRAEGITGQVVRFDGHTLSLVSPPIVQGATAVTEERWSADRIADAFDDGLRHGLQPVGFVSPARPSTSTGEEKQ